MSDCCYGGNRRSERLSRKYLKLAHRFVHFLAERGIGKPVAAPQTAASTTYIWRNSRNGRSSIGGLPSGPSIGMVIRLMPALDIDPETYVLQLWKETATVLKAWHSIRPISGDPELILNATGHAMTRSSFEYILAKHVAKAARKQSSIAKKHATTHVLHHTCAMHTLQATQDVRKARRACLSDPADAQMRPLSNSRQTPGNAEGHASRQNYVE